MKRYLIPILVAVLVLTSGLLVACGQKSEPIPFPDKPLRSEKEMTYALYDYFLRSLVSAHTGLVLVSL